jgi:branched-chain amino acid transport system substrate-binding protein
MFLTPDPVAGRVGIPRTALSRARSACPRRFLYFLSAALLTFLLLAPACGEEAEDGAAITPEGTAAAEPTEAAAEEVQGVTDTEILLGTHMPLSGSPVAAFAPIGDGMRAYFDYINDVEGGVYGRKITLLIEDDHYNPADATEVVRKLVEEDGVFAIISGLGEEPHGAVWRYLEEKGIPDMFIASGAHKWTDPVAETRFGGFPDYMVEGRMLGKYIVDNYDGKRLGVLMENNELGEDGLAGAEMSLEGSEVEIVTTERCEAIEADMTAYTQRLRNADVDVVLIFTGPLQAASVARTANEVLNWDVPILVTGIDCSDIFMELAGESAEGVVSVVFAHQVYETELPGVQKHHEIMENYGHGVPAGNLTLYGTAIGELMVEALKNAGPDLTRESLVEGAESIRGYQCSVCMTPVYLSPTDHRPYEIEVYNRVEGGKWVAFGEPVDFETTPLEERE